MRTTPPIYKYSGMIAGFGLAAMLIGFIIFLVADGLDLAAWIIVGLGICLLAAAIIIDFSKVKGAVTGKRGRFSAGSTVMVFVFVGIILLVNAISFNFNKQFDITELSQFTITTQTKDVLADVSEPIDVLCFFTPEHDDYGIGAYATSLLDEYQLYSDELNVKTIDPDAHPDQAREYSISQYQTVVFETELGRRTVFPDEIMAMAEHAFTSAILEVTGTVQKTVYFLTGHGEASTSAEYGYAALTLGDALYKVYDLDLMSTQQVPDDCSVLIIAAPVTAFNTLEINIIRNYIDNDGSVILLVNPDNTPDDIKSLLAEYYLQIEPGTIIDPSAYYSTMDNPIIPRTQNEFGLTEVYFPGAAAIKTLPDSPENIVSAPLFYTSAYSWSEKNFDPNEEPEFNEATENLGARAIGVLVAVDPPTEEDDTTTQPYTQIIVVGDSDFATNTHFFNSDNAYQFLSMVEYLTSGEEITSIDRKVLSYRSLIVTSGEESLIRVLSVGLLPALILIVGSVIWWRRR